MRKTILAAFFITAAAFAVAQGYKPGDKATDFKLKNIDGTTVSMNDYADAKGFIVIFTCNHCPFSIAYEDRIIDLDLRFKELGYPVIAINPNDPAVSPGDGYEDMQKRAAEKGFTFPYLIDEGQKIFPAYGAIRTPHVFVLNREKGEYIVEYIGAIDDNHQDTEAVKQKYVEDAVYALIKGNKPVTTTTKAIGCTIKVAGK